MIRSLNAVPSLALILSALLPLGFLSACAEEDAGESGMKVEMTLDPSPPRVGDTKLRLRLQDMDGKELEGAKVRVEANMNHAGMVPVFSDPKETSAGVYESQFKFTMGGDWYLAVTVETADGKKLEETIDVPNVSSGAE